MAAVIWGTDGNFYGTTYTGGANGKGTVFQMTPGGTLTTMYSFCAQSGCADGSFPAGLVQGTDGNFYGLTASGGGSSNCGSGCGAVFKITPSGTLTTLHSFDRTDGQSPLGGLVQGTDGNFYGTTNYGGAESNGTVFKITPAGTLTTLYSFCEQKGCPDGYYPQAALVQGTDGNFYGTTPTGGAHNDGTVFAMTPSGTLTTLYSFCSQNNCADGDFPVAGLLHASDGNFYGTTQSGAGGGTVFQITSAGTLTALHRFTGSDGASPEAGLVQAPDGSLYGTTEAGGANNYGTVFSVTLLASPTPQPTRGPCAGDCDGSGDVAVNEVIALVNIALGTEHVADCPSGLAPGTTDADVTVAIIIQAVNNALGSCPGH